MATEGLALRRSPLAARVGQARRAWALAGSRRPPTYVLLVAVVAVLNVVGLVMVLSASSVVSLDQYGSSWRIFERQVLWSLVGAAAFVVAARVDYRRLQRVVVPLLVVAAVLLVLVLVPGLGVKVSGSRRWLGTGSWRFQPSELAKLALLVYAADVLTRRRDELHDWRRVLRPVLVVFGGLAFLVLQEPDMDSTIVLALVVAAVLVVGGVRLRHLAVLGGAGLAAAALLAVAAPYRRARVFAYLNPWSDPSNTGYQIAQSLIALGSGGWTGVGLGSGRAKWMFLPNAHTDFIFAIVGEELGLLGCLLVLLLFGGFAVLGVRAAIRAPDRFGTLLAAGITAWVVGQALINIGAVIGLLPVSGITLPFVSFGGSALVFTMAAAGILGNVARQGRL
ncbi:MAG: putative lipid II flippase FtsW [Acidimicrobiia bacterium]|nr:putative lipid II flippase FtsW [Acidimicrobiia bacterium]